MGKHSFVIPFVIALALWIAGLLLLICLHIYMGAGFLNNLNTMGNGIAILNTLFSGLAFAGIFATLQVQVHQYKAFQNDIAIGKVQYERQVLEAAFFQLIKFNNDLKDNMVYKSYFDNTFVCHGLECFQKMRAEFSDTGIRNENWGKKGSERFVVFLNAGGHNPLGHYFRNIYQVIYLVETSSVENKRQYMRLVRAQLSNDELYLLFYNGLSKYGIDKFHHLLVKYAFFEHFPVDKSIPIEDVKEYGPLAFGNSTEWLPLFEL